MAITFDGQTKIISLASITSLSVRDLYSYWKKWILESDNSKYLPAFDDVVGGNPIDLGEGIYVTSYFFLINGWKIRPQESDHKLRVYDGVLLASSGDPFVYTIGNYNVLVQYSQPIKSETISTGGGSGSLTNEEHTQLMSLPASGDIIDAIWDEPVINHILPGSTGLALKYGSVSTIRDPLARGGTINSIIFDVDATSDTDAYNNALIVINGGTGTGQVRTIVSYDGITKTAFINLNWVIIPDETSQFSIIADSGPFIIVSGRVESSTNTGVVLSPVAIMSDIDDVYDDQLILIASGLNAGQTRRIISYNSTTRLILVHQPWNSNPTNEDTYQILPNSAVRVDSIDNNIMDSIWDVMTSGHTSAGTTGKALLDAGSAGNPWSSQLSINNEIGTFGEFVQTLLTTSVTGGELSSIPDIDSTLSEQIQFLFQYFRNKRTVSGTQEKMYKEDGTVIGTSTLNDDGTTFTRDRMQ